MTTQVVNKYKVCMTDPDIVYIGRGGMWGNPFPMEHNNQAERDRVVDKYRGWLWQQIKCGVITKEMLLELDGKRLACYCSPKRCHGHVLVAATEWVKGEMQ